MEIENTSSAENVAETGILETVAILIAKGLIAGDGFDLGLYRTESTLDGVDRWKVEFILKERYEHFNVRCATVYVDKRTGQAAKISYHDCGKPPSMEHATKAKPSSMPDGSIGIYIGDEKHSAYEIAPWGWEALFWDELGATDPNYAPDWQKRFADSIPNYPTLAKIRGEYGSKVTFEGVEIDALIKEGSRIVESARNPIASEVVKRILTACELAKQRGVAVHFVAD